MEKQFYERTFVLLALHRVIYLTKKFHFETTDFVQNFAYFDSFVFSAVNF